MCCLCCNIQLFRVQLRRGTEASSVVRPWISKFITNVSKIVSDSMKSILTLSFLCPCWKFTGQFCVDFCGLRFGKASMIHDSWGHWASEATPATSAGRQMHPFDDVVEINLLMLLFWLIKTANFLIPWLKYIESLTKLMVIYTSEESYTFCVKMYL
jgi:hypothetical protein